MTRIFLSIGILGIFLLAACGVEDAPPLEGTVLPKDLVFPQAPTDETDVPGDAPEGISPGFRLAIDGEAEPGVTAGAVSSGGFVPFITVTASVDGDDGFTHAVSLAFRDQPGVYELMGYAEWMQSFETTAAGFSYTRNRTEDPSEGDAATSITGTLEILQYQGQRVSGHFTAGGSVAGDAASFSGDFNVQVVQQ
jgi:hypothetical protein